MSARATEAIALGDRLPHGQERSTVCGENEIVPPVPSVLLGDVRPRDPAYRAALMGLTSDALPEANEDLIRIYRSTKDLSYRFKILRVLADCDEPSLQKFFADAYARERHLDMKLTALRGLAQFVTEAEIDKRLIGFRATLKNIERSTPLNFAGYEMLRSRDCLPYLVDRYGYASLNQTLAQVQEQYDRMPDAVKGLLGDDEAGNLVLLVPRAEYDRRVQIALAEIATRVEAN